MERANATTMKGRGMTLAGPEVKVGNGEGTTGSVEIVPEGADPPDYDGALEALKGIGA